MTYRAYAERDHMRDQVAIHLGDKYNDGRVIAARFEDMTLQEIDPMTVDDAPQPLRLPEDAARALYEELARYFGGAPDMATLRRDYDAERGRVDKFIAHLTRSS